MAELYTYKLPVYNVPKHNNPAHNNEPDIGKGEGFTKLNNKMADALMKCRLSGTENQVFWVIFRKTLGWRKKQDQIALSQFETETGIARKKIPPLIRQLVEKKMVIIKEKGKGWDKAGHHNMSSYAINSRCSQWKKAPGIKQKAESYFTNRPSTLKYHMPGFTVPQTGPDLPQSGGTPAPQMGVTLSPILGTTTDTQKTYITNNTTSRGAPDEKNIQITNFKLQTNSKNEKKKENKQKNKQETKPKKSMRPGEKINNNKITGKTKKPVEQIINFAAKECKVTIIGDKLKLLNQLMGIYDQEHIKSALKNFAGYQQEPRQDRRYPISNDFRSFVHKFDEFADGARVTMRLEAEKRWDKEGRGDGGAVPVKKDRSANDQAKPQDEFDPIAWNLKEIAGHEALIRKRKFLLDMYQESIDKQGKPPKEALDLPTFRKYENFTKEVQRAKNEIKELRAEIALRTT